MKIFKNFGKTSCFVLAISLLGLSFSCAELEEDLEKSQLSPQALTSSASLRDVITSIYRVGLNATRWSHWFIAGYGGDDITTESGLNTGNKIGFREADWRAQTKDSERTFPPYRDAYRMIAGANVAINAQASITSGDKADIDRYVGEAYFLRAYAYMHLTRTYGSVPIVTETGSTVPPKKAAIKDIYTLIEADLLKAESLLPVKYPGIAALGARPSQGAAKAMLARLYMHWAGYPVNDTAKYAMAATKAGEVVNGSYGYELSESMRKMWTVKDRFNHKEGVFTLVYCQPCGGNFGNRTTGRLGLTKEAGGWQETFGEIAFFEDMEAAATADGTLTRFNDTYVLDTIPRGSKPLGANWRDWSDPHPLLRKIAGGDMSETKEVVNTTNNSMNRYVIRYADVLLTYAEATGRSGANTAEALEALNKVRRRAAGKDVNTADASIDKTSSDAATLAELAYTERKWELAGEYERWFDLLRMKRFNDPAHVRRSPIEPVDVKNSKTPASSGDALYFTPIPQQARELNPNL